VLEREAPRHAEFPIVVAVIVVVIAAMVFMRLRGDPPQECPVYSRASLFIIIEKNVKTVYTNYKYKEGRSS